ncbi:MAG TPA: hypothetical protein VMT16_12255 [Thermoanaerobaculia bacterium]|nr:hypothetical protein [Thermoanaerobaculia bacterium]
MQIATEERRRRDEVRALLRTLRERRSRRFGLGMRMAEGPLAYASGQPGVPLSEEEEALLVFAACGITGYALADLSYARGQGGTIMSGLVGRTVPSGDAIQMVALVVSNSEATYYLRRPQDFPPDEIPELVRLAEREEYVELYRRGRVKIRDGRATAPRDPIFNINCNLWSLYDPAATYLLPVNELTQVYVNGLLEILNETTAAFVVDERAGFRPAGLARFARSRGGHLDDDPRGGRVVTVQQLEGLVTEFVTAEQGMMLQNVALMTHALGLGGFPHWAAHPFGWFQALGCRMARMPASRYLGMGRLLSLAARALGRDGDVPYVLAVERDGEPLLAPFCPPHYPSMEAAVREVHARKLGPQGIFRGAIGRSAWREPERVAAATPEIDAAAIDATIAYCEYVYRRYGRFPAYAPPLRTVLGFQANHLDVGFYDRFYRPEALAEPQRRHFDEWHAAPAPKSDAPEG